MTLVKFDDPDEFLAELERDRPWIEDDIVRVTRHLAPVMEHGVFRSTVIATAIVRTPSDRRTILQFSAVQGTYRKGEISQRSADNAAEKLTARLTDKLDGMQCDIRPGAYQDHAGA